jgi:hypothetical protein
MAKVFKNLGLRRDLNFSDVENPRAALSNLLNNLVTSGDGESFTADDLDCIQNISASNTTAEDFRALSGVAVERTTIDSETGEPVRIPSAPLVTIKNQIDTVVVTTRDPPYFNGGNGLDANFYDATSISTNITKTSTGVDLYTAPPVSFKEDFWDNGFYEFSNKLDETLGGSNGMIQWEGWYVPDASGTSTFGVSTTGFFMLELENVNGDLEVRKTIFSDSIDLTSLGDVINDTRIYVSEEDWKTVANGAYINFEVPGYDGVLVSTSGIDDNGNHYIDSNVPITLAQGEVFNCGVHDLLGSEEFSFSYAYNNLEKYVPKKIRMTYWYPGTIQFFYKVLDVNLSTLNRGSGDLPFWYLYTNLNAESIAGFKEFYESRVLSGGGTIGPEGVTNSTEYNSYASISPLIVKYVPPKTLSEITIATYSYERLANSNVLSVTPTSPFTTNLEVGNVAAGTGIPKGTNIVDIANNTAIILDLDCTADSTDPITFINHRGLVDYFDASSSGNTVTTNMSTDGWTTNLRVGMVVVTSTTTDYVRITEISPDSGTTFTTDTPLNLTGTERIYVYRDKGLDNQTLENYCTGVIGTETTDPTAVADAVSGRSTLFLDSVDGLTTGMVAQSTPYIPNGTTIFAVNPVDLTVELSSTISTDMITGITVVFAPAGTTQNKEACVIPLNTAPPFVGTETGLATTNNVSINNGDFHVTSLGINNAATNEISGTPTYNRLIDLDIGGVTYKIMASTSQT